MSKNALVHDSFFILGIICLIGILGIMWTAFTAEKGIRFWYPIFISSLSFLIVGIIGSIILWFI